MTYLGPSCILLKKITKCSSTWVKVFEFNAFFSSLNVKKKLFMRLTQLPYGTTHVHFE